jgi:hypothetical protein
MAMLEKRSAPGRDRRAPARVGDQPVFYCNVSRAERELGWTPRVSPEEGVDRLLEWITAAARRSAASSPARAFASPRASSLPKTAMSRARARVLLLAVLLCGAILRFQGLNWDEGHHLHPDERFISMVEEKLTWPASSASTSIPSIRR